jgi:hypothetical protein
MQGYMKKAQNRETASNNICPTPSATMARETVRPRFSYTMIPFSVFSGLVGSMMPTPGTRAPPKIPACNEKEEKEEREY